MRILRGDIWYVDLGEPNGSEQGGARPCLILQNNKGNAFSNTTVICPISSNTKSRVPTHVHINCLNEKSVVKCEQVRVVDKNRLERKIGTLNSVKMSEVELALRLELGI